jgi:hypothetical protein
MYLASEEKDVCTPDTNKPQQEFSLKIVCARQLIADHC